MIWGNGVDLVLFPGSRRVITMAHNIFEGKDAEFAAALYNFSRYGLNTVECKQ